MKVMTKEDYQQWAEHPLTQAFHQYLMDYRRVLMEKWATGTLPPESPECLMAVARCQMADELVTLEDDAIGGFYREMQSNEGE